jgi:hypothetical protein
LAIVLLRETYIGVDDANIAMVYARNLAAHHGFVYNVGGEHVEGFTSLLYVLLMAVVFAISPLPELCLLVLCTLLVTVTVFLPVMSVRGFTATETAEPPWLRPLQIVMIAWTVCSASFIIWTTVSLMDTALWALMWSASTTVVLWEIRSPEPSRFRLCLMSLLAFLWPLARPEGFAAGPVFILTYALGRRLHTTTWRQIAPSLMAPGLAWLLAAASVTAFRIAYFGFPLPNTYYAKVSPNTLYRIATGARYLFQFVSLQPALMYLVLGASVSGLVLNARPAFAILMRGRAAAEPDVKRSALRAAHFTVGLLSIVGLALPAYGGGDHFAGFRFYQPIWPMLSLTIVFLGLHLRCTIRGAVPNLGRRRVAWTVAIALLPVLVTLPADPWFVQPQIKLLDEFQLAEGGRRLGAALNRLFPEAPPRVAVTASGGVQYTYQGPVFDLLGLNHVQMGHSPGERRGHRSHAAFDKTVFWSVAPPIVSPVLCSGPIDEELGAWGFRKLSDNILQGLFRDAAFEDHYLLVAVRGTSRQRVFDSNPFFFMPQWFPHPSVSLDSYRDATLIAYVERGIIDRLVTQGWRVVRLSERSDEAATRDLARANGPCTPPKTRASGSPRDGTEPGHPETTALPLRMQLGSAALGPNGYIKR